VTRHAELVCGNAANSGWIQNEWSAQYPVIPGFQRNRALPCCSVTGEIPLTNARAAREVVERSRRLTVKDLGRLVRAQHKVSGYLGTKRSWKAAYAAAITAMDEAGRTAEVHLLEGEAFFAVIVAAVTEAANKGKDTRELMLEAQRFRSANTGRTNWSEGAEPFTRCLRNTIGKRAPSRIGIASIAAGNAIRALALWDIAREEGSYTIENRRLLVTPWLRVARLPSDLFGAT
jgi:hypothetical protein